MANQERQHRSADQPFSTAAEAIAESITAATAVTQSRDGAACCPVAAARR
jgi:hypothetical protein